MMSYFFLGGPMSSKQFIQQSFQASAKNYAALSENSEYIDQVVTAAEMIVSSLQQGGGLFAAGNGGSAADAQHIVAELVVKLDKDRTAMKAMTLSADTSILTAVGNDFGYDYVFARQVKALMKKGDIFFAITTSGNSKNILEALKACRQVGAQSILLTGKKGGLAVEQKLADHVLIAPGQHTANIQEAHMATYHTLCFLVEKLLIEKSVIKYEKSF
jgi:D-sedoheptulose 7-phosphate isomerase